MHALGVRSLVFFVQYALLFSAVAAPDAFAMLCRATTVRWQPWPSRQDTMHTCSTLSRVRLWHKRDVDRS